MIVESDWVVAHQWAGKAGLDVIDCISPDNRQKESEESEDPEEIISFSDHMHFNASWQLGYGKLIQIVETFESESEVIFVNSRSFFVKN